MKKIPLTQGKFALVDDEDYAKVSKFKWCVSGNSNHYYAVRGVRINGKDYMKSMHRFILSAPNGIMVDHKNMDGLDNRKSNLRLCNKSGNMQNQNKLKTNTSGFKGVVSRIYKGNQRWIAQINLNNKNIYLGIFFNIKEAARAYNKAALKYHGEFARLNKI